MSPRFRVRVSYALTLTLGILCVLSWASVARGQVAMPEIDGYARETWGVDQGLPQGTVQAVLQTRDGYLWLATFGGLVRFDGLTFAVFDVANTPGLSSNRINTLYEDRAGALWIGSEAGVIRYRDGTFTSYTLGDGGMTQNAVDAIREDPAGRLWIATSGALFQRDGDRFTPVPLPLRTYLCTLLVDRHGDLWVGMNEGVVRLHDGRPVRAYTPPDGLPRGRVFALHETHDGTLWVGSEGGLARLVDDRFVAQPLPTSIEHSATHTRVLFEDRDHTFWLQAGSTLLARRADGVWRRMTPASGYPTIRSIIQDREGHLWFGMLLGPDSLQRLTPHRARMIAPDQPLGCGVSSVTQGPDGTVWAGRSCGGLLTVRDGRIEPVASHPRQSLMSLLATPDGALWTGSWGQGLFYAKDGRIRTIHPKNVLTGIVLALYQDRDGIVWAGHHRGFIGIRGDQQMSFDQRNGMASEDVRFITADRRGALWLGATGALMKFQDGRFTNYTSANGHPLRNVRAIQIDEDDALWIGTYGGGLYRMKNERFVRYTTDEGLIENAISRILEDNEGTLWLSGNRGITRVSRAALDAVADGTRPMLDAVLYGKAEGMTDLQFSGGTQPAGWKMRDGSLWFPTEGGNIVRIDPAALRPNRTPPPIVVEQVTIDEQTFDPRNPIQAAPGAGNVEVRYAGLSFAAPERNRFKYRLEGYDKDWVEAGTRRVAYYTRLPPGSYRFRLIGSNSEGTWNEQGATLAVSLAPHWYQRRFTHFLGLLALAALVVAGHRLRLGRLTRRARALEERVAERTVALAAQQAQLTEANVSLTERTAELAAQQAQLAQTNARLTDAHTLLRGAHESMLSMLAQLRLGLLVVAEQGSVTLANDVVCSLLGVTADDARTMAWERLLPLSTDDRGMIRALVQTPQAGRRVPVRLTVAGRQHAADVEVQVDPDAPQKRIIFLHDITELCELPPEAGLAPRFHGLHGDAPAMRIIRRAIEDLAPSDATVLVEGETGTGKELVAHAIHATSSRRNKPLVAVNCAGLTESLLASQLFGHRRGAFTGAINDQVGFFEAANGGTIFLDEIGDMPVSVQMSLLRVLQEREILRLGDSKPRRIDVRVIAATHRHVEDEVREGRFRQDLFYRVCVARIAVPSLRDRREDIPVLASVFLTEMRARNGKPQLEIGQDAMDALCQHNWPGNVRQLRSAIESAVVRAREPRLRLTDLPIEIAALHRRLSLNQPAIKGQRVVLDALTSAGGNRALAARLLGISRTTLYRRIALLAAESGARIDELAGDDTSPPSAPHGPSHTQ